MATILIVDERREDRQVLASILAGAGQRVLEAADGPQALGLVVAERPDLAIADVVMPGMSGYEFVRQLRGYCATPLPIVFCTAPDRQADAQALAQSCGVRHVLLKPVEAAALHRAVGDCLGAAPEAATVLVVEDEQAVRALVCHALTMQGYRVLEAGGAQAALHLCDSFSGPIHLLVVDVVMPELGGRQLAERLAVAQPAMKVLYISGHTDDAVIRHGVSQATVAFLQKPFTPSTLAAKVREVLGGPSPGGAAAAGAAEP